MRYVALVGLCAILAACQSDTIYLRNRAGNMVTCGPFAGGFAGPVVAQMSADQRLRDCVTDYQRQGYERAPN